MRSWHGVRNPKQKQLALSGKTGQMQGSQVGNSTKLVACWEDSWLGGGGGGGGGLFGSIFCWDVCELAVGYVICKGGGG
jgi:hypothetical protein